MATVKFHVYFGLQLYGTYGSYTDLRKEIKTSDAAYAGGYVFVKSVAAYPNGWFKLDMTPLGVAEVPEDIRMLNFLLQ